MRARLAVGAVVFALFGCTPRRVSPLAPPTTEPPASLLTEVTPVPGLAIRVYAGRVDAGTVCWTFVTSGRARQGRPELVLSVVRRPLDHVRRPPADAYRLLAEVAAEPDVAAWGVLPLAHPALGQADRVAVVATPAQAPAGVPLPPGALALLPVTATEAAVVRQFGAARWLAMRGLRADAVAAPWWFDRDRPPVVTTDDLPRTRWRADTAVRLPDLTAAVVLDPAPSPGANLAGTWHLALPRDRAVDLADALARIPLDGHVVLALTPDPDATARLAWQPGHLDAPVVGRPPVAGPPRVGASVLELRVEASVRGAMVLEDGVVVVLSPAQRDAAVAALRRGAVPTSGAPTLAMLMPWRVDWR